MLTSVKVFLKRQLIKINTFIGNKLPVVDLRDGHSINPYPSTVLVDGVLVKGNSPTYFYDPKNPPYWIPFFEEGVEEPPVQCLDVNNALLIGRGVVMDDKKRIVLESTVFQREYLNKLFIAPKLLWAKISIPKQKFTHVIPIMNKLTRNYHHWMSENMARLVFLMNKDVTVKEKYTLFISADAPQFIKDSLKYLVQWPQHKIRFWKDDQSAVIEHCKVVTVPYVRTPAIKMVSVYHPEIYRQINKLAFQNISPSPEKLPEYFIVSRAKAKQRNLLQEEKIIQFFPDLPVKIVYTEEMSFVQQVQMFKQAKLFITAHGAALTNVVYCNSSTVVVEFYPENRSIRDAIVFYQIARSLEINYHLIQLPAVNEMQDMEITDDVLNQLKGIVQQHHLM